MRKLAVIPARAGSKRIPGKNIKMFCGAPIISYSIRAAIDSNLFDKVIVYTDSSKCAKIAKDYGAEVPFPREKAGDEQGLYEVVHEVLMKYSLMKMQAFDFVCLLYPCAPLIKKESLEAAYNLLLWGNHDSVFPVVCNSFHYQRLMYMSGNYIRHIFPAFRDTPSNTWHDSYRHAGQFFWWKVPALKYNKTLIPDNSAAIVLKSWEAIEIDTQEDWDYAEVLYKTLKEWER